MSRVQGEDGSLPADMNEEVFASVMTEVNEEYERYYPAHNDAIKEKKKQEYKAYLERYLKETHKDFNDAGWKFLTAEGTFRTDGLLNPTLNQGITKDDLKYGIRIGGHLDRIDYRETGHGIEYRIVDYKTGKKESLDKKIDEKEPKQIQHELYMALLNYCIKNEIPYTDTEGNQHKLEKGDCIHAEYHFVLSDEEVDRTPKRIVIPEPKTMDWIVKVVRNLFEGKENIGHWNRKDNKDPACTYCAYQKLCER